VPRLGASAASAWGEPYPEKRPLLPGTGLSGPQGVANAGRMRTRLAVETSASETPAARSGSECGRDERALLGCGSLS
jgi:hypothetical protein